MFKKTLMTMTTFAGLTLGAGSAFANGDGDAVPDRAAVASARPIGCVSGAGLCPAYPREITLKRAELAEQLMAMSGCTDGDESAHRSQLARAGKPAVVSSALAHLALADPNLSLQDVKNALELMEPSAASTAVLQEVFGRSTALVDRVLDTERFASLGREARTAMVGRQAAELRRVVVLTAARDPGEAATRLLSEASRDADRSVAIFAARALEARGTASRAK